MPTRYLPLIILRTEPRQAAGDGRGIAANESRDCAMLFLRWRNSPLKNAIQAFFNLAKCGAKPRTARKIATWVAILSSHPCDVAARRINQQAANRARYVVVLCALGTTLVVVSSRASGQESQRAEAAKRDGAISNVVSAWEAMPTDGKLMKFAPGAKPFARGGHFQGIQIALDAANDRHVAFLSHDSETVAYLVIVEFPSARPGDGRIIQVHEFPSDGQSPPLRHAGGIQLLGDILAVGLEDNQQKGRSEIQFWDVAKPTNLAQLKHLTIRRTGAPKDKTAGGVGLVQRERDVLVAVANWDSRAIDFYASNGKPLADRDCRFEFSAGWRNEAADKSDWQGDQAFGTYQAVNLVADANRNLFLIGFDTNLAGQDFADLFAIDMGQSPGKLLRKLSHKPMKLAGANHFRYSGGIWIHQDRLSILSTQRDFNSEVRINIVK
jgi:hypothetical protein